VKRKTIYFTAPGQVELREEPLPAPGADEVLVQTIASAISAGTEMLVYHGRFPRELEADSAIGALRGAFAYPLAYGYAAVGKVVETGRGVDKQWRDRVVFSFHPHTSHFACKPGALLPVPEGLSPESACFLPNMETAVNFLQDGAPILGERVLVLGQGVVGLLTASLLHEYPLDALVTADRYELRRHASSVVTRHPSLDPAAGDFYEQAKNWLPTGADLTFELSGHPEALNDAIALTTFSGRILIGSWYGEKRASLDLGGAFHRSRIQLISSQVSTLAPQLSGRWDKARRFDVAWKALIRINPDKWITHRFPLDQAADAYHMLDETPRETIQVIFTHRAA
jgi:2-desacetyl-2-hydroxyethyl bacteriochlorophyllide A dehydrogenase